MWRCGASLHGGGGRAVALHDDVRHMGMGIPINSYSTWAWLFVVWFFSCIVVVVVVVVVLLLLPYGVRAVVVWRADRRQARRKSWQEVGPDEDSPHDRPHRYYKKGKVFQFHAFRH